MNNFNKFVVSENEVKEIMKEHNVVQKDGSVLINRTYADVAKQGFETYRPSSDDLSKFQSKNPNAIVHRNHVVELNPNDDSHLEFKMPCKNTLYKDN